MRNKYYLDDDYEDNMFNLDWFYCRFSAPTAIFHRILIKDQMELLMRNLPGIYEPPDNPELVAKIKRDKSDDY